MELQQTWEVNPQAAENNMKCGQAIVLQVMGLGCYLGETASLSTEFKAVGLQFPENLLPGRRPP